MKAIVHKIKVFSDTSNKEWSFHSHLHRFRESERGQWLELHGIRMELECYRLPLEICNLYAITATLTQPQATEYFLRWPEIMAEGVTQ